MVTLLSEKCKLNVMVLLFIIIQELVRESSNVLSLLKMTEEYPTTVAKDNLFYLDANTGIAEAQTDQASCNKGFATRKMLTDAANENKISIPLNIYSYLAAFKNNIHPNLKVSIFIRLENNNNIIFRTNAAPDSKVLITVSYGFPYGVLKSFLMELE